MLCLCEVPGLIALSMPSSEMQIESRYHPCHCIAGQEYQISWTHISTIISYHAANYSSLTLVINFIFISNIMAVLSKVLAGLLATVVVNATPFPSILESRGTIGSSDIVGFKQTVPSGTVGNVYLAYQPYLKVVNGCVPFPAVDAAGNTKLAFSS